MAKKYNLKRQRKELLDNLVGNPVQIRNGYPSSKKHMIRVTGILRLDTEDYKSPLFYIKEANSYVSFFDCKNYAPPNDGCPVYTLYL